MLVTPFIFYTHNKEIMMFLNLLAFLHNHHQVFKNKIRAQKSCRVDVSKSVVNLGVSHDLLVFVRKVESDITRYCFGWKNQATQYCNCNCNLSREFITIDILAFLK